MRAVSWEKIVFGPGKSYVTKYVFQKRETIKNIYENIILYKRQNNTRRGTAGFPAIFAHQASTSKVSSPKTEKIKTLESGVLGIAFIRDEKPF